MRLRSKREVLTDDADVSANSVGFRRKAEKPKGRINTTSKKVIINHQPKRIIVKKERKATLSGSDALKVHKNQTSLDRSREQRYFEKYKYIIGVDEAGRG